MNDSVTFARIRFASDPLWTQFKSLTHWWPDRPQSTRRLCGASVFMCDVGCEVREWVNSKSLENDFGEGEEEKIFALRVNGKIEKMQIYWCVLRLAKCYRYTYIFCLFPQVKRKKEKLLWLSLTHSHVQKSLVSLIFISSLSTSCTTQPLPSMSTNILRLASATNGLAIIFRF